jgi:hypothetical protein
MDHHGVCGFYAGEPGTPLLCNSPYTVSVAFDFWGRSVTTGRDFLASRERTSSLQATALDPILNGLKRE